MLKSARKYSYHDVAYLAKKVAKISGENMAAAEEENLGWRKAAAKSGAGWRHRRRGSRASLSLAAVTCSRR